MFVFCIQTLHNQKHLKWPKYKFSASLTSLQPTLALFQCLMFIQRNVKAFPQKVHKGKVGGRLCPVCGRRWIVHRSSLGAGARRKVSAAQVPTPLCSTCGELHKQGGDQTTVHIEKRSQKVQPIRNAQLHLHNQLLANEAAPQLPGNLDWTRQLDTRHSENLHIFSIGCV